MAARILIADDNPHMRQILRNLLEQNPEWQICGEAADGQDAISKVRQLAPDLVILDFLMPGMNGLDVAREISKVAPQTPMLMCTLYLSHQLTEIARSAGLRGAVPKDGVELLSRGVEALLRNETFFAAPN
ncbi:MAG TPA: response regulator transcription factor [Terriglobales bacterium]|jgi:DNA-binding NarL/FixJ family response regulator|nr:response regulator transcription factor [Terriglobales bacterium]